MTRVATVLTLISDSVQEEIAAEGTQHELVELPLDELVAVHFVDIAFAFPDRSLTPEASKASIQRAFSNILLYCLKLASVWGCERK